MIVQIDINQALSSPLFSWVILPALIFFARIIDVSLGTLRLIFVSKGIRNSAPIISFFEILIWLLAISQIMRNLQNVACYIAYAGGYATGTYIGMCIEQKLCLGLRIVRVITKKPAAFLVENLESAHYGTTCIDAKGAAGKVNVIFTVVRRSDLPEVVSIIKENNPQAFYTVEDVRSVQGGVFPFHNNGQSRFSLSNLYLTVRKGK